MKASEAAFRAARIVSEKGHCKHIAEDDQGRVCLGGAIAAAISGGDARMWLTDTQSPFSTVLEAAGWILNQRGEMDGESYIVPVLWNNLPETTAEDVILLLKETGAALEARGC